ncbi:TetR/AcrR family transcriptional regulator C-terminal domain-containing protein [Microbacterium sediminicola]|uniref:TetR/AcrR family transcriptional regulator C-terminal domain-containing protein n=2 Tax=Microbacterium sediminicola TaxID=415210 RepID=A0ABN2I8L2_9MICO
MPQQPGTQRVSLDRGRIIAGAVELADEIGLEPLTIRKLADRLGARPMSLYHYVNSKDDIVDGMVGRVFTEVGLPAPDLPWQDAIRDRARSLRAALRRHPWAIPIMESRRTPGVDILEHHDAVLAIWMRSGLPMPAIAHGVAIIDAFVYGFAMQEAALPLGESGGDLTEAGEDIVMPLSPDAYPALVKFTMEHVMQPGYNFGDSFEVGLDIVIAGVRGMVDVS